METKSIASRAELDANEKARNDQLMRAEDFKLSRSGEVAGGSICDVI